MTHLQPLFSLLRSYSVQARPGFVQLHHGIPKDISRKISRASTRRSYYSPISKRLIHQSTAVNGADNISPSAPSPASIYTPSTHPSQPRSSSSSAAAAAAAVESPSQDSPQTEPLIFKVSINPSTAHTSSDKPSHLPYLHQFTPPSSRIRPPPPSSTSTSTSTSPLASLYAQPTSQLPTQIPPTPPLEGYPYGYHVARTASAQLPVYQTRKRGGNLLQTLIRKITGNPVALRDELVEELDLLKKRGDVVAGAASGAAGAKTVVAGRKQVKKAKKEKYVRQIEVDDVCWVKEECGHVVIKGHYAPRVLEFLKARGF